MDIKTPSDLVHRVVAHHGPVSAKTIATLCAFVGYPNTRSTQAVLFNARKAGTLIKDIRDQWVAAKVAKA